MIYIFVTVQIAKIDDVKCKVKIHDRPDISVWNVFDIYT